jgi:NTP pyrophosphatase (non-canonical NTP hydrolase)
MKVIEKIKQWHYDRNLIEGSTDRAQFTKLMEEVLELHEAIIDENGYNYVWVADAIGDIVVVLVNIAERNGLPFHVCVEHAYDEIKDRKGKMVDGVFVKEDEQRIDNIGRNGNDGLYFEAPEGTMLFNYSGDINRFEYITEDGREVVSYAKHTFQLQDDMRTLKVFREKCDDETISIRRMATNG